MGLERTGSEPGTPTRAQMFSMLEGEGDNPTAREICRELTDTSKRVDPDAYKDGFSAVRTLDKYGIYGDRIVVLYHDVCEGSVGNMIAVLRAFKFGILDVDNVIESRGEGLDLDDVIERVQGLLPNFSPQIVDA